MPGREREYINPPPEHDFVHLRNAKDALAMLAKCGDSTNVSLCALCQNQGQSSCPHLGMNKTGLCGTYALDESDLPALEVRYFGMLLGTSH